MKECQNVECKEIWCDEYLKWICGFSNAQGGKLYIGIDDSEQIVGVKNSKKLLEDIPNKIMTSLGIVAEVNLLQKGNVEYIEIIVTPSNLPIAYRGIYHYRSGSTKQELQGLALQNFLLKKMGVSWDNIGHEYATVNQISLDAIEYFQRKSIANERLSADSYTNNVYDVLENLRLIDDEGHLKNAALLLFGKDPARYFPLCDFRIGRFGNDETDLLFHDVINGDIIRMADRVIDVLRSKYLISPIRYSGLTRVESLEIPEEVLREAIFNAIIHKDYTGVPIQMKVYNDRVELWNQGKLPEELPLEKLFDKHSSFPRNKKIAEVFYRAGFIESWGRGIKKIFDGTQRVGLISPKIEEVDGGVRVTIYRNNRCNVNGELVHQMSSPKSSPKDEIVAEIRKNPKITLSELAENFGVSVRTIKKYVSLLKSEGVIARFNSARNGCWIVLKNNLGKSFNEGIIPNEKVHIENEKVHIENEKVHIEEIFKDLKLNAPTKANIVKLYEKFGGFVSFGRNEVCSVISLKDRAASLLISKMLSLDLIERVKGQGKGKYRFCKK